MIGAAVVALAGIAAVAYVTLYAPTSPERRTANRTRGNGQAVPVLVAAAKRADVPVYLDAVGSIRALNMVTVRAQVDGKIQRITFKEGQDVQKGDVLVELDPAIYKAQHDQAVAKKAQDQSLLDQAKLDLERFMRLAETNAVARQQVDNQRALVAQREAQLLQDDAAIASARAYLEYTTIRAPINGRTGIRQVDEGNLVRAADAVGIVVITQVRPISVIFSLPQQQLTQITKAMAEAPPAVDVVGPDGKTAVATGALQVLDNQVDQVTGTVKLKAEFPNADLKLWPGQFVNVRMLVDTLKQVVVVPTSAVQRGPNGTFVFVLREGNTVGVRAVTVSQQDELQAVVATGVQENERVVTSGFARLADGSPVTVTAPEAPTERRAGEERRRGPRGDRIGPNPGQTPGQRPDGARRERRPQGE
jgi:multidrug efflux system membrane fusion protein